jgi:ubiquinone/menaquinone biosynthesis C-methylase UbiE
MAAPMIRYGHMRSNRLGVNVNYSQRLAEDNQFPDNYFDIIISTSFHHEVTEANTKKIFAEVQRTLRPGGVFRPAESGIDGYGHSPLNKVSTFMNYRWNHEVWVMEWSEMDRFGSMRAAGLKVNEKGSKEGTGYAWIPGATAWKV